MKIIKAVTTTVCILGLASLAGQALAGKGPGQGQFAGVGSADNASTKTMTTASNLVSCDEFTTISGQVKNFVTGSGNGMEIDLGEGEIVSIYGIGSLRYWSSLGVDQPTLSENVEVEYATITFSDDSTKNVAITITFLDSDSNETVILRDDATCVPLWRGSGNATK